MNSLLHFIVEGSKGDKYEISASRAGDNFRMSCTCEAGQNGMYCKHRFALMNGDIGNLLSDNSNDVRKLKEMLAGTDVERRYKIVVKLEQHKTAINAKLKIEKRALAREING